ncbi:SsnA Cytosine deaminase and related metal-dependent hydrolases [Paracoccaceae bacterium]|jgi:cytosine deaminase
MQANELNLPDLPRLVLAGARVPAELVLNPPSGVGQDAEGALFLDLLLDHGRVAGIFPAGTVPDTCPRIALEGRHLWPAFIDMHTHLDCGHAIPRVRPDGTIHGGFSLTAEDWPRWSDEDLALRMDFGMACAFAHGVSALRSHVDSETLAYSQHHWQALDRTRRKWAGRVDLQGVTICAMEAWVGPDARALADLAADMGGVLGGVTDTLDRGENGTYDALGHALDRLFALAHERGLDVDLHVDQTEDLTAFTIPEIAKARLRSGFQGRVVLGHCVNLSLMPPEVIDQTLTLAREADLAFVSMPTPMMYLMDRKPQRTPRWRGVTAANEIRAAGLPLAIGGDNCRDAWYPYGDHDMLDTLKQAIRTFQADEPLTGSLAMASRTPADLIGRPDLGRIGVGLPAHLVIFNARSLNVVLARDQADRIVLSHGRQVTDGLPQHHELEAALGLTDTAA